MKTWMIAALLLLIWGCDDQGLPPDDTLRPAVSVQFLEASCTEVWLRLAPRNVSPPYTLTLLRDDSAVATISSPPADTTVIDEGLSPFRTYTYRARLTSPSGLNLTGDAVQARTLDTTSHQFTWETTVLGDGGSSIFYDVAIVNDTLAYAVGEVYLRDSSGVLDPHAYNLAKWDGRRWWLRRVPFIGPCSAVDYPPIRALWPISPASLLLTNGGSIVQYDAINATMDCRMNPLLSGAITKIWASAPQNVYAVGRTGTIVHFDGSTWRRVESGTTVTLLDVFGRSTSGVAWTCGWDDFMPAVVIRAQGGTGTIVHQDGFPFVRREDSLSGIPTSVWTPTSRLLFVATSEGVYRSSVERPGRGRRIGPPAGVQTGFPFRMRGTGLNDLLVVGEYGMVLHYNGMTWARYPELESADRRLTSVAVNGRQVLATGFNHYTIRSEALVLRGVRR